MSAHITTFGIEFEACLVYSEETLKSILREYHIEHTAIIKGHPLHYTASIKTDDLLCLALDSERCRQHYPSWALAVSCEQPDLFHHMSNTPSFTQENQHIRNLFMEHLLVAKEALAKNPRMTYRPISSPGDYLVCPYDKVDYTKWTLTNDLTVTGSLPSQIIAAINSINADNIRQHNSSGLEIITPIFHFADLDALFDEIDAYLAAVSNGKTCHAMTSVWAGMHVHVGIATDSTHSQDEAFIRNLMYILLLHEDLITQCFPRNRSGEDNDNHNRTPPGSESSKNAGSSIDNLCSSFENLTSEEPDRQWKDHKAAAAEQARRNSMSDNELVAEHLAREQKAIAEDERAVLAVEANHTDLWETHSNARSFAEKCGLEWPLDEVVVREIVFDGEHKVRELLEAYQTLEARYVWCGDVKALLYRGWMYNFSNLYKYMYSEEAAGERREKPTIEFGQHECCIEAWKAKKWVRFLEALTKKAADVGSERLESPFGCVDEFCGCLRLNQEDRRYWAERWEFYHLDRPSAE